MWPFKKAEINYYRVKRLGTKYLIERKLPEDFKWTTLHYYPSLKEYRWYTVTESNYIWVGNSLEEARNKITEFIPEYFYSDSILSKGPRQFCPCCGWDNIITTSLKE